jgi:hypothetical protein
MLIPLSKPWNHWKPIGISTALRCGQRYGRSSDLIELTYRQATRFVEGLEVAGFEILTEVVLNQVLVSFGDADTTRNVIVELHEDGSFLVRRHGLAATHGHAHKRFIVGNDFSRRGPKLRSNPAHSK